MLRLPRRLMLGMLGMLGCEAEHDVASTSVEPAELAAASPWLPGPASKQTRFDPDRLALDRECRSCHVEAAAQWQHSQHAGAWASPAFQRAFASEPRPFCQGCHAPEADPREPVPKGAGEIGVGCVTCHVEPGSEVVWAGEGPDAPEAPHPIARAAAFEQPGACGGCHEFEFPDPALRDRPLLMQSTLAEHRDSAHADQTCVDCHMPREPSEVGPRSHAFPGAYDPTMLRRALAIAVTRPSRSIVRIELRPGEVGHAVPTGDLLRRLEVALVYREVDREVDGERVIDRAWLGREFEERMQSNGVQVRVEVADHRVGVGPGPTLVELEVPADLDPSALRWRVRHQRVATHARHPRAAAIEGQLEIASGSLPCPSDQPECES